MIALLAIGAALWLGGVGFTLALCRAASMAPPSVSLEAGESINPDLAGAR